VLELYDVNQCYAYSTLGIYPVLISLLYVKGLLFESQDRGGRIPLEYSTLVLAISVGIASPSLN
jgi:hypothetical protein